MSILYFDLDGTLVDVRKRHYAAYADTMRELGLTPLPEQTYWDARRDGASNADLMGNVDAECQSRFAEKWLERVESPSYVRLDTLIPGARATLAALRESYELVLVTMRQDRASLLEQLDELSLRKFFSAVYSRDGSDEPQSKSKLIRLFGNSVRDGATVIGDSEADVEAARDLGIESVCVTSGVRSRRYLDGLEPDEVVSTIVQLPRILPAS
ncbi:MAG: HAD family hydrolase [Chloroflexi bacterium]|nr:HAD family hydrolase [Chloroflexota bacterium]MCH8007502.1 HAD family hydrolase [Chloroflexota bacterium]